MKISATYTEIGGPWGYGHQEPYIEEFEGSVTDCQKVLHKALTDTINFYSKINNNTRDIIYDIMDYLRYCNLCVEINGKYETRNLWNVYEDKIREIVTPKKMDATNIVFDISEEIIEEDINDWKSYFDSYFKQEKEEIDINEFDF